MEQSPSTPIKVEFTLPVEQTDLKEKKSPEFLADEIIFIDSHLIYHWESFRTQLEGKYVVISNTVLKELQLGGVSIPKGVHCNYSPGLYDSKTAYERFYEHILKGNKHPNLMAEYTYPHDIDRTRAEDRQKYNRDLNNISTFVEYVVIAEHFLMEKPNMKFQFVSGDQFFIESINHNITFIQKNIVDCETRLVALDSNFNVKSVKIGDKRGVTLKGLHSKKARPKKQRKRDITDISELFTFCFVKK